MTDSSPPAAASANKPRVLIIHNEYAQHGGERVAVQQQMGMLCREGHEVRLYTRDNAETADYGALRKALFFPQAFFSIRSYREIRSAVRAFRPDVAHVHNVFPLITPSAYWALRHEGVPIVQTLHNYRFMCTNGLLYRQGQVCELCRSGRNWHAVRHKCFRGSRVLSALYASVLTAHRMAGTWRTIDRFIALTEFAASKIVQSGVASAERVDVLGNSLPAPITLNSVTKQPSPSVVYVGRLSPEKGVHVLIDAARIVPDVQVTIYGTGPDEARLKEMAIDVPNARFGGWLAGPEKFRQIASAHAVVLPSLWYEGFPLTLLEAMACGTAVLASRIAGIPDVLTEGADSLLFAPGDSGALAELLRRLAADPDAFARMGQAARRESLPRYSESVHYQRLLAIQQRAIQEAAARRAA